MQNGYRVSHPSIDTFFSVLLDRDEHDQVQNELAQVGEGGKIERLSDLPIDTKFDDLVDEIRNHY